MKKQISIFLTFLLVCSVLMTGFTAQAEQTQEKRALRGFIDGITQLVREYDADKDFSVSEPEKADTEQTFL